MSNWIFVCHGERPSADYYLNLDTDEFKKVETSGKAVVWAHVYKKDTKIGEDDWVRLATLGTSIVEYSPKSTNKRKG